MKNSLYIFLKFYSRVALHFYFSRWQINGVENIPEGPVIFVPNHQNAFLDAVLIACSSSKNPWFITRSDVFRNPLAKKMLTKLQMLPVYRFRDGYQTLKQNDAVMNECVNKIHAGESLLIFAEGNHGDKYQLRPLQKGVARIAFSVKAEQNLCLIPVGIQYDLIRGFRSRALVNFGKPVYVNDIQKENNSNRDQHELLLLKLKVGMKELIIHIDDEFYEDKLEYLKRHRIYTEDLTAQLKYDQQTLSLFPQENSVINEPSPYPVFQKFNNTYIKKNLFLPSYITKTELLNRIKDPQFGESIKFATGMFLVPLFWILQVMLVGLLTKSFAIAVIYLLSLPISLWLKKA